MILRGRRRIYGFGPPRLAGPAMLTLLTSFGGGASFLGGARWAVEMALLRTALRVMGPARAVVPGGLGAAVGPGPRGRAPVGRLYRRLLIQWAWDSRSTSPPAWYPRLRTLLTLGAVLCLSVALEATLTL
jgi:hypothetical protein